MTKVGDINLVLSLLKCLDEEMHLLKFEHTHEVKQKFNKLMKSAQAYEKTVYKHIEEYDPEKVEEVYDQVMDCILDTHQINIKK